jgi:hypothetical protein
MRKSASVYQRKGRIFVHAESETTAGVWILDGSCKSLLGQDDPVAVGTVVAQALESSRTGIAHPSSWGGLFDPVLREAGVRTWSTFVKGAQCLSVSRDDHGLNVVPMRNGGSSEGFAFMTELKRSLPSSASAFDLGSTVLAALADSQ